MMFPSHEHKGAMEAAMLHNIGQLADHIIPRNNDRDQRDRVEAGIRAVLLSVTNLAGQCGTDAVHEALHGIIPAPEPAEDAALVAAREWYAKQCGWQSARTPDLVSGRCDDLGPIRGFRAGAMWHAALANKEPHQ